MESAFNTDKFNSHLSNFLNTKLPQSSGGCPEILGSSMKYSALLPGKRIRPQILTAVSECFDLSPSIPISLGIAMELVHCFSLIHDDLPCLDNDDFRRGSPSNHKVYGEAIALLAGDALIPLAYEAVLEMKISQKQAPSLLKCLNLFSHAMGANGMIGGQAQEVTLKIIPSEAELKEIHQKKTGALFHFCFIAPLCFSSQESQVLEVFSQCGFDFGACFQALDDIEDLNQDTTDTGKNHLTHTQAAENLKKCLNSFNHSIQNIKNLNLKKSDNLLLICQKFSKKLEMSIDEL